MLVSFERSLTLQGINSVARKIVLGGEDLAARKLGFAAYRATVDVERMKSDAEVSWILKKPALNIWYGKRILQIPPIPPFPHRY